MLPKILSTSILVNGNGFAPFPLDPINPVTPGVFLTINQASSFITISTKIYPGNIFFTFSFPFSSTIFSSGTTTLYI